MVYPPEWFALMFAREHREAGEQRDDKRPRQRKDRRE